MFYIKIYEMSIWNIVLFQEVVNECGSEIELGPINEEAQTTDEIIDHLAETLLKSNSLNTKSIANGETVSITRESEEFSNNIIFDPLTDSLRHMDSLSDSFEKTSL